MKADRAELTRVHELVREMRVSEAMMREVVTVAPETPMRQLRQILSSRRISGTPVVEGDQILGVVSLEDFINWLSGTDEGALVQEKMTRTVVTVGSDEPLIHAIGKMEDLGYGRLPVVGSDDGKLVGIITKGDVIEGLLRKLEVDYHQEETRRSVGDWLFDDVMADSAGLNLEYNVVGGDVRNAGKGASRLRRTLARLGMGPQQLRRTAIATYEAEMNMAIYTDGGVITIVVHPAEVSIVAKDAGPGIPDIEAALRPGYSTAPPWVRELGFGAGMGLNNIKKCSDRMDLVSEVGVGTRLEARIALDKESA
jgi:CBS domain-containing protein/anti-sigma regulatory factor (Ser/Thr protein kinase)